MRRPSFSQSHLRFPLSHLLGNEGAIRVLRALIAYDGPLSTSQLARECGLSLQGTRKILDALVDQQFVSMLGQPRSQLFAINRQHPLASGVKELFKHEQSTWDELMAALRTALLANTQVDAAWYYGSVARGEDEPRSDLDLAVVACGGQIDETVEAVRQTLREVEDRFCVSCSVVGLSPADVTRLAEGDDWWRNMASDAKVLKGVGPAQYAANNASRSRPT